MNHKEEMTNEHIVESIVMVYDKLKTLQERLDCIFFLICTGQNKDTHEAIREYLISDYRNKNGYNS